MRDTLKDVIPLAVRKADSLEEAIRMVDEEVDRRGCLPVIAKEITDKLIERKWQERVNKIRRLKASYK